MTTKSPTQKYRDKMKRDGFQYMCFWVRQKDVKQIKEIVRLSLLEYAAEKSAELLRKAKKK